MTARVRSASGASVLAFAFALVLASLAACHDGDAGDAPAAEDAGATSNAAIPPTPTAPPKAPPIVDAGPPDARAVAALAALADAGAHCGSKDQPTCPLQQWMKDHASPMILHGDIPSLAETFEQIARLAPPRTGPNYEFPYWVSIAKDGADAVRYNEIVASRAACRGCHVQYRAIYHDKYRGRPLPDVTVTDAAP